MKKTFKNKLTYILGIIALAIILNFSITQAAPDSELTYHGKLTDTNNVAVSDGDYDFTLTIYDADTGGNCLWTSRGSCGTPTSKTITITNGIFSTTLGETGDNLLDISFDSNYYLGVTINSNPEMTPRRKITPTGFALNSHRFNGQTEDYYLNSTTNQTKNANLTIDGDLSVSGILYDSNINAGTNGQILSSTTTGTDWIDNTFLGLVDTMSAYTAGSVLFTSPTAIEEDNTNFFWDNSNNRLGINTNTPATTLDVNGGIKIGNESSACIPVLAGTTRYNSVNQTLELCDGSDWQELSTGSGSGGAGETVPAGTVVAFATNSCPTNYISAEGQEISRAGYPDLYTILGDTYGSGDGSTTFDIPDYRGQFLRGWDNGAGTDPDAASRTDRGDGTTGDVVGSMQDGQNEAHLHSVDPPSTSTNSTGNHRHSISGATPSGGAGTLRVAIGLTTTTLNTGYTNYAGAHTHTVDIAAFNSANSGGNETRPTNINVLYCIKSTSNAGGGYLASLWDADTDTGIQTDKGELDDDTIRFDTNGVERLQITNTGNLLPSTNDTYDLGSSTNRFRDLYLGPNSLHIGTNGNEGIISYDTTNEAFNFDKAAVFGTSTNAVAGMIRWSGTDLEGYDGSTWNSLTSSGGVSTYTGLTDTPASLSANQIQFANSAGNAITQNSNFTYDGNNLAIGGSITLNNDASACDVTKEGAMRYNDTTKVMEFCNGTAWGGLSTGTSGLNHTFTTAETWTAFENLTETSLYRVVVDTENLSTGSMRVLADDVLQHTIGLIDDDYNYFDVIASDNIKIESVSEGFTVGETATFDSNFSVGAQETAPNGITFNNDGTKMFITGTTGDDVNEYHLSIGFDTSTAVYDSNFSVAAQETAPNDVTFNTDGTKMFIVGTSGDDVNEYHLSTGFDVSTAVYDSNFSVAAQDTAPQGIDFNTDGTKMFIVGNTGDDINEYHLSTGFDVSTAVYDSNFSVAAQDTTPTGIAFNGDGTKMFITGSVGLDINEYELSTGFDISTANFVFRFSVSAQESLPQNIAFNNDGTKMFVTGTTGDDVNEYHLPRGFEFSPVDYSASFSVAAQDTSPQGITFNTDGTKMFIVGATGTDINEYHLSTAFDVTTAVYDSIFDFSEDAAPQGIAFNTDGTKMFIIGNTADEINEYNLSTAFDVSTAVYDSRFDITVQEDSPTGIAFNTDGTKMFITGVTGDDVNEYHLSTGFDISTTVYDSNFSVAAQETGPQDITFNIKGTKMFIVGSNGDEVNEYNLSNAFDVSTAVYSSKFGVLAQDTSAQGIAFNNDGTKMFITGSTGDDVTEYAVLPESFSGTVEVSVEVSGGSSSVAYSDIWTQSGSDIYYDLGNVGIGTTTPDNFTLQVAGNIGPDTDDTYDLGSSTNRFRDLYLGPSSLHIGEDGNEAVISYNTISNEIEFSAPINLTGSITLTNDTDACDVNKEGAMRYNDSTKVMEFCNGTQWGAFSTDSGSSGGGGIASIQTFDTAGAHTWTKPVGIETIRVQVVGAGGGGSSAQTSGGGGAGGYAEEIIDVSEISSETVTIGSGGTVNNGGGSSSFGSLLSATGGSSGNTQAGGAGGSGFDGDINTDGGDGGTGFGNINSNAGTGGASYFGGGGTGGSYNSTSAGAGSAYGSGGGGAGGGASSAAVGANGAVIIYEYAGSSSSSSLPTCTDGQTLSYNETSSEWECADSLSGGGDNIFLHCTNEQSDGDGTDDVVGCGEAATNIGGTVIGTSNYIADSCTISSVSSRRMGSSLKFVSGIWQAYDGSNWVNCDDGSMVVMNLNATTGSGISGGQSWSLMHVQDQKTTGSDGGSASTGDNHRTLNTILINEIAETALTANEVTLPVGTYYIDVEAPALRVQRTNLRIDDENDNVLLVGSTLYSDPADAATVPVRASGQITLTQTTAIKVIHYTQVNNVIGLGGVADSDPAVFTDLKIWKIEESSGSTSLPTCTNGQTLSYNEINSEWECADAVGSGADLPDYDSGWVAVTKENNYQLTHNLGTSELNTTVLFKDPNGRVWDATAQFGTQVSTSEMSGHYLLFKDDNTFDLATANDYVFSGDNTNTYGNTVGDNRWTTGEYRIYAWDINGGASASSLWTQTGNNIAYTSGNVGIGSNNYGTNADNILTISNSIAPTTSITDGIQLFAVDQSGSHELRVRDEAGNTTTLSPHNFSNIPGGQSEELAWSYYSEKDNKSINVDMTKTVRLIEKLTGQQLIYITDITTGLEIPNLNLIDISNLPTPEKISEIDTQINNTILQTNTNIQTLQDLQLSVDENLNDIEDKFNHIEGQVSDLSLQIDANKLATETIQEIEDRMDILEQDQITLASIVSTNSDTVLAINERFLFTTETTTEITRPVTTLEGLTVLDDLKVNNIQTNTLNINDNITTQDEQGNEINASSIGTATIVAGETEVIVESDGVHESSRVFVTPISDMIGNTFFVEENQAEQFFKIVVDVISEENLLFNWFIVN
ncbi:MAG: tail fiber protein [Candidatus Moraniibacteriota bacterium]